MSSAPADLARKSFLLLCSLLVAAGLATVAPPVALAQDGSDATGATMPQGLWLTTPFPEFSAQSGDEINIDLTLTNHGVPPQRAEFDVTGLPEGWQWEIIGNNRPVNAAIAPTDEMVELQLGITPPKDAAKEAYSFTVSANAGTQTLELPISLTFVDAEPAQLTLEPELPALRGTPGSSFDFQVTATNEGQEDTVVNLLAEAPAGFQVTFTEGYGSQELTSLPIDAGQSKDLKVSVSPPDGVAAGQYPVMIAASGGDAQAEQRLMLDITGQPELALSGPGGRLSGSATAGDKRTFNFTLENTGTAPARQVSFSSSPPNDWEVTFEPKEISEIPPGETSEVAVSIAPSTNAIAGDYVVPVRTSGEGVSDDANFRVTVETSTMWGVAGLGVIAAAVVVLGFSVSRYGRR